LLLVALLSVAGAAAVVLAVSGGVRRAGEQAQTSVGSLGAALERTLGAIRTVKLSTAEERETEAISKEAEDAYRAGVRAAKLEALVEPIMWVALQASFVLVLGVGGARLASGAITLEELVAFLLYLFYLAAPLIMVFTSVIDIQRGLAALARIREVLDSPVEPAIPTSGAANRPAQEGPRPDAAAVVFASVTFAYEPGRPVLQGVTFEVPRFSRAALVGPSGAGKSTVFALIARFYEPNSGVVLVDDTDVRELLLDELRRKVGYVEQEAPVMAGSIRQNLLYANPAATEEELDEVLGLASLRGLVAELPRGLETEVGESGVLLSGGERQRVAIARMLLAKPQVLLLDEVTSRLDSRNELALKESIRHASERCTVLMIAHRLSTVVDAHQIVVLDRGAVKGIGTHEELYESNPLYRELAQNQLVGVANGRQDRGGR
jgi:ABC-type multidrug transport system fused ATPase/permease subunit